MSDELAPDRRRFKARRILDLQHVLELRLFWDEGWFSCPHNADAIALSYGIARTTAVRVGNREMWYWLPEAGDPCFQDVIDRNEYLTRDQRQPLPSSASL